MPKTDRETRCEHGVRWPWACPTCDEAHLRTPAGEAGGMVERSAIPVEFYQWLYTIERDVRVWDLTPNEISDLITRLSNDTEAKQIVQKHYAHIASLDREAMTDAEREQTRGAWNAISAVMHEIDALAKGGAS